MPEFIVLPEPEGKQLDIDEFTRGYMECAVWLAKRWVEGEEPEDAESGRWSLADIGENTRGIMADDCYSFQFNNKENLERAALKRPMSHLGHDFFLTRNWHGTGFWDRGLGQVGDDLTEAAEGFGGWELEFDDTGLHGVSLTQDGAVED